MLTCIFILVHQNEEWESSHCKHHNVIHLPRAGRSRQVYIHTYIHASIHTPEAELPEVAEVAGASEQVPPQVGNKHIHICKHAYSYCFTITRNGNHHIAWHHNVVHLPRAGRSRQVYIHIYMQAYIHLRLSSQRWLRWLGPVSRSLPRWGISIYIYANMHIHIASQLQGMVIITLHGTIM